MSSHATQAFEPTPQPPASDAPAWRLTPGYLSAGGSEFESVHILLGRFLADRHSPDPLGDPSLLKDNPRFEWGAGQPLEKVVDSKAALEALMLNPQLYRNSIAIIEPWEHVGYNPTGEHVRASLNVAYLAQKIADCSSILFPLWKTGLLDIDRLMPLISSGIAVVVEGGDPSVRNPRSFAGAKCSHEDLVLLTERILLSRTPTSAPALLVCLGHQLAAQAHVSLIRRAVAAVLSAESLASDPTGKALRGLQRTSAYIKSVGQTLRVRKRRGRVVAGGWNHKEFAVAENEFKEFGHRKLQLYRSPDPDASGVPDFLVTAHEVTADQHEGVIDTSIAYEHDLNIAMFHSDEVNEEAILFANWAYRMLHDALIPIRHLVANSPLSWLIRMPDAIEILCSTAEAGAVVTECSATCINYTDFETKEVRRSFTCQFHPELLADLRVVGMREPPSYRELKQDDGARLFARLLYHGMQE
jgi:GMP synthase-like glutamine amidotransferase